MENSFTSVVLLRNSPQSSPSDELCDLIPDINVETELGAIRKKPIARLSPNNLSAK